MKEIKDIQFILVLYKESLYSSKSYLTLSANLKALKTTASLFVYDNSPDSQEIQSTNECWEISYVHDPQNSGLSVAYNLGAQYAKTLGKKWLFLLDQDTDFPEGALLIYMQSIANYPEYRLFAPMLQIQNGKFMSPCKYQFRWGKLSDDVTPGIYAFKNTAPVNSGLLVDAFTFSLSGGYNEKVRVDGCDFQFIERFKKLQQEYVVINLTLQQDFSFFETSFEKQFDRFTIFLVDMKNSERESILDGIFYFRIALKRALFLTVRTKSLRFITQFYNIYLGHQTKVDNT